MSGVRFTPQTRLQLNAIWRYSVRNWGERRADSYLRAIDDVIAAVASGEKQTRACEQYGHGLQSVRSGSHYVYLRHGSTADVFIVMGVLHQGMEPSRHLRNEE